MMKISTTCFSLLFLFTIFFIQLSGQGYAAQLDDAIKTPLANVPPEQVDSILAKLSDEQVRTLLINELTANATAEQTITEPGGGIVHTSRAILHLLDPNDTDQDKPGLFTGLASIPSDCIAVVRNIGNGSIPGFLLTVVLLSVVFGGAFLAEYLTRRLTADFSKQFSEKAIPDMDGAMRFVAGIMRAIPSFIHILIFSIGAVLLFSFLPASDHAPVRYFFMAILSTVVFFRVCSQCATILFAPQMSQLRLFSVDDASAVSLYRATVLFCSYTYGVILFLAMLMELQLGRPTLPLLIICTATTLIGLIILGILRIRNTVQKRILAHSDEYETRNWIVEQFARFWHVPTLLYFFIVWLILLNDQLSGIERENSAFLLSLLILPLYVLFDWVGQWVVRATVLGLKIYNPEAKEDADEEMLEQLAENEKRERKFLVTGGRLVRLFVLAALLIWVLSLWGFELPYATNIAGAIFESLITMALGLAAWRFASRYIEEKIAEDAPDKEEEAGDDEFGGAAQRGRGFTLLPLLRKVIASILLVMVTLVVLSSLGVNIGPLLAGAGVVGLAVGFGAQKLVSDIFSGFFYLLDDAFRVGEYIQAGSVSGAVESITLRNVMLRHHRGMLQIVPHSDLGSITNFMRGGIIVKFNLDFPYDADVEKIRKIIKRVGKAMMEEEQFKEDFINPVKSAGVREITGSVMTIRVKFKAQPGTHFVIRREAYRLITEALNAKGIFYAHRKVIVELPDTMKNAHLDAVQKEALVAGAAAEIEIEEEEAQKKLLAGGQKSGGSGMAGI